MDVTEFPPINSSSPEAMPDLMPVMFVAPLQANAKASCPNNLSLPRLLSPFIARGAVESANPLAVRTHRVRAEHTAPAQGL
ncbi:hypothetical protein GPECTOR_9g468 [Gonium pectorale]|uniref:Uncharacterized protein n=1 Tax=Gonium pectorale TaxID=33097 RepID=A0A150GRK6_GONPE|nr:hypothetical protein GPECTOR_9g468 [Gonium pectorale]|eukprot:KXZ52424.1 hypothetical protein GPECTOR_9g468 [Gonium pectorale]